MGTITAHDRIMLDALAKVSFGRFNQKQKFVDRMASDGVATDRQRWYLTKLVEMHRKQITNTSALATADKWLRENAHLGKTAEPPAKAAPKAAAPPPTTTTTTLF